MNTIQRIKIDISRKIFLLRIRAGEAKIQSSEDKKQKKLARQKKRKSKEAERLHDITGKRYYVILAIDRYVVVNNSGINSINKTLPKGVRWDYRKIMENCVYATK